MSSKHISNLLISLAGRPVGKLATDSMGKIFFEYDAAWLASGFDIAPYTIRFGSGVQAAADNTFGGLHGPFYDSLPDGWGLLLMDRALKQDLGWPVHEITMLDRLAFIGCRAMGALEYQPEIQIDAEPPFDLAQLAANAELVLEGAQGDVVQSLVIHGGSPGGARPKVTVARHDANGTCVSGNAPLRSGFEHWLVKFRGKADPIDAGRIEKAYAAMAELAGLHMPPTTLIETAVNGRNEAYFAVKRFDRDGDVKIHMLSLCGHLHASHRVPSLDYDAVIAATARLTESAVEAQKAFRLMVFNAVAYNRDDHSKNFSYLRTESGWTLSPPYDLTMSYGMSGQHTTAISGSGDPDRKDIERVAHVADIDDASAVIDAVVEATGYWSQLADEFGVTHDQKEEIGDAIERMRAKIGHHPGARIR